MKCLIASRSWATLIGGVIDLRTQRRLGEAELPSLEDEEEVVHSGRMLFRPRQA